MNISVNWLRELAPDLQGTPEELADRFSMTAAAVETLSAVGADLDDIVVARVLSVAPHPNADRLSLCEVDAGNGEPIRVVCGAPVIHDGATYPYVRPGVSLPGGFEIESRKIRGEMSHGMLCSEYELQIGRDRSGILRLADDLEPGVAVAATLGLPDVCLTLDLNPNRVDLACHMGVARELAPRGDSGLVPRDFSTRWEAEWADGEREATGAEVTVTIEDLERCPRYLAAVVRGVKVGPSPAWLAGRLLAIGARPINNVVDATNYVLFELNQPLHAFDLATLSGGDVRVRAAVPGESLSTLDGEERELDGAVTVIADADRPVALAGVMGGLETQVTEGTKDLLIECASFDPLHTRNAVRRLTLPTDASYRFEREIDEHAMETALRRCVELILATAGGEADPVGIRTGRPPREIRNVAVRPARVRQVLGLDVSADGLRELLEPLGFTPPEDEPGQVGTAFVVPGWRNDVTREIDLVEEVARRFGYEHFPDEDRRFRPSAVPDDPAWGRTDRVCGLLSARGLLEARSSSFVPERMAGARAEIGLMHPLSAEEGFLRSGIVPVLIRRAEHNFAQGNRNVRLFEIGTVFRRGDSAGVAANERTAGTERYAEELRVGAVMCGSRDPRHWAGETRGLDVWDLKGLADEVADRLLAARLEPVGPEERMEGWQRWVGAERFRIVADSETVGLAGRVDPSVVDAPPWAGALWGLEFRLDAVVGDRTGRFGALSPYPAVRRDLAVTLPIGVDAGRVEAAMRAASPDLLESVELFDVYAGEGVEEGRRSLAWAFRFRSQERTLTDDEVEALMRSITQELEKSFDARVRTT